jgi:hypothetical protein
MRNVLFAMSLVVGLTAFAPRAKADRVFLAGGTVLEGTATRKNGKVVVEIESGQIAVPADSVERIEKSESVVSEFDKRYAALPAGDAKARLALADFCRDHDMRAREHKLLLEVIDLDPDNAAARARLGYQRTETGWVTEADAMRAKGFVQRDGRWMSEGEARERDRQQAELEASIRRRDEAESELASRRAALDAEQAAIEAERNRVEAEHYAYVGYPTFYTPVYPLARSRFGPGRFGECVGFGCAGTSIVRHQPVPGFSPNAFESSMSVVKVPYRRH